MSIKQNSLKRNPMLPPTWLLIALVTMLGMHFTTPVLKWIPAPWNLLGLLLVGIGLGISYMAEKQFHRVKTTVKPFEISSTLVTDGVFRFSRNPMYLGFVLILVGVAFLLQSLTPLLVIPTFIVLINRLFIRIEEDMLADTFGREWLNYTRKVRRWI